MKLAAMWKYAIIFILAMVLIFLFAWGIFYLAWIIIPFINYHILSIK